MMVCGFGGFRMRNGQMTFKPWLPPDCNAVEFTEAEAKAAAGAVWAYIDDDYYPRINIKALRSANIKLIMAIDGQGLGSVA